MRIKELKRLICRSKNPLVLWLPAGNFPPVKSLGKCFESKPTLLSIVPEKKCLLELMNCLRESSNRFRHLQRLVISRLWPVLIDET